LSLDGIDSYKHKIKFSLIENMRWFVTDIFSFTLR
jgi:hypothetical protein